MGVYLNFLVCYAYVVTIQGVPNSLLNEDRPIFLFPSEQSGIDFGYSISLYKNETHRNLLVGAPLANTAQDGVTAPGALYSCNLLVEKSNIYCSQLNVDTRNAKDKYVNYIDEDLKDFQRLGGSLSSKDKDVVVCAPNWHYYEKRVTQTIDAPVGICFRASSLEKFQPFSLPYDLNEDAPIDYLTTGSCQAGFSLALSKDHSPLLGSPGCYNWEGDVFAESSSGFVSFRKGFTSQDLGVVENVEDVWLSNMYLGYSVAEGEFRGQVGVAAGMPRSSYLQKKIYVPNNENLLVVNPKVTIHLVKENGLDLWTTLTPPKNDRGTFESVWLFSYFGYSLAVADVDGNGLDDVIVGAPFYHNETNFDQGVILVYMQMTEAVQPENGEPEAEYIYHMFLERNKQLRMGRVDYERFGSCVSNAGDLDGDGIHDIVVGAPYTEGGKVYIYLGNAKGLSENPHQILSSSDDVLKARNLKGFGSAFAPSFHLEEGSQSDIAIGAALSDTVVIFKSKVMINVDWKVEFPQKMDLRSNCSIEGKTLPCVEIVTCLSFAFLERGKKGDTRPKDILLNHDLDVNSFPKRLFFDDYQTFRSTMVVVEFEKRTCFFDKVYTDREIYNLDAFEILSSIAHVPRKAGDESTFQPQQKISSSTILEILFECRSTNVSGCISDLHLKAETFPNTVKAEAALFNVFYEITNFGESSYSNKLELYMDRFLEISGKAEIDVQSTLFPTIDCKELEEGRSQCSLGPFINTNDVLKFRLSFATTEEFLEIENLRTHATTFEVKSSLTTLSDIKYSDAVQTTNYVAVETDPEVFLTKNESSTDLVTLEEGFEYKYPSEAENESEIGPRVTHIYEIYNKMEYAIENNKVRIYWPYEINEKSLLDGRITLSTLSESCKTSLQTGYVKDQSKNLSSYGDVIWKVTSCSILYLEPRQSIDLRLDLRLVFKTLLENVYNPDFDEIRSYIHMESNPVLLGLKSKIPMTNDITTKISYGNFVFRLVPLWVYILGVLLGIAVLILLICCLRRLNFFKRNKREDFSRENLAEEEVENEEATAIMSPTTGEEEEGANEQYDNV